MVYAACGTPSGDRAGDLAPPEVDLTTWAFGQVHNRIMILSLVVNKPDVA